MTTVSVERVSGDFHFRGTDAADNTIDFDLGPDAGGEGLGVGPMTAVAMSLASCSLIDVQIVLAKKRLKADTMHVTVDAERRDEHPRVYNKVHLTYRFTGENLDEKKVRRAIDLSLEKYCSVNGMVRETAEVTYDLELA